MVDAGSASYAAVRRANQDRAIVHAIVSCKWTLRSDRAQNARSEALNSSATAKAEHPTLRS
ncbi:NgoMIV family type II restriction endonuclease [Rhodococcus opacus]|uniref:NgoMIV family type II restriction endonuclease n=1 Tax=Rhodococcus opacus TaxID=37919 RepID=UPI002B279A36|nr:NgoMIV family type II restriction endonuclease [Rhodococcus opacus]